jgi:hypothetical protein
MTTITLILILAAAGTIYYNFFYQGSTAEFEHAKEKLSLVLDKMFLSTPLSALMGDTKECQLSVKFTVNEDYELTKFKIVGGTEELVKYTYSKLSEEVTKLVDEMVPSNYDVKLKFVLR